MTRALLLLLLSTTVTAQTADLRVTITALPDRIAPGTAVTWTATLENAGPDAAEDVFFDSHLAGTPCFTERFTTFAPGARISRDCSLTLPEEGLGTYRTHAVVNVFSTITPDPDQTNNIASETFDLNTPPDLVGFVNAPRAVDPGLPFPLTVAYANNARTAATGVTVTVDVPEASGFVDLPPHCSADGTRVTCAIGNVGVSDLTGSPYRFLDLHPVAPDSSQAEISASGQITAAEGDARPQNNTFANTTRTYRTFFVTNTNDAGPGSLRDGIVESNVSCVDATPCKIAFRIPGAAAAWQTIEPRSALPAITGVDVALDGTTQTRYFGDNNPLGPEIELRGTHLRNAIEGITMAACNFEVLGLTINSFPNAGLHLGPANCKTPSAFLRSVARNYLGTDPTGMHALPNNRGIYVDRDEGVSIFENVISGNSRAGIFVHRGFNSRVFRNVIGLNAAVTAPLGNGAAGVYLDAGGRATDVYWNYIGFNAHAGVALHREAWQSAVFANSIQANGGLGMDFGHDSVSEEIPDMFTSPSTLRVPEITNAFYNAARDETVIEGTAQNSGTTVRIYLYANDAPDPSGYGEGQYYLGETLLNRETGRFRFVWPGRLPGPWVAATVSRYTILFARAPRRDNVAAGAQTTSSEFSRTVQVQ